jgi:hypothetical protein
MLNCILRGGLTRKKLEEIGKEFNIYATTAQPAMCCAKSADR